jgi:hypothetical protein
MTVLVLRLLVDFGLVILIWLTQLIIYPAFVQMDAKQLQSWHPTYNRMITIIVAPLMFAQLVAVIWQIVQEASLLPIASLLLVIAAWVITFLQAVPKHQNITEGLTVSQSAMQLVNINWRRTAVWSLVFLLSLYEMLVLRLAYE